MPGWWPWLAQGSAARSRRAARARCPNRSVTGTVWPKLTQRGVDAALQGAAVVDQVRPERAPLALGADTWCGQPRSRVRGRGGPAQPAREPILSVLAARGAQTLWFHWICDGHIPAPTLELIVAQREPVIDSMTALTSCPCHRMRLAEGAQGVAVRSNVGPRRFDLSRPSKCTSSLWRDRSNPASTWLEPPGAGLL